MTKFLAKYQWLMLGLLIAAAVFVRFYKLGEVPIELTRDEASLGYTAHSLLETGKEEHGVAWPVQIESFGDWKLPLYVYTLIPFVKVFGLTAWSVRLPSALAGVAIVLGSFFLAKLLTEGKRYQTWLSWGTALLVTFSPWAVHFAHEAYEAHLSLALFVWGLVALLTALKNRNKPKIGLLLTTSSLWALTLIGYHAYQVFVPAMVVFITWLYWPVWRRWFGKNIQPLGLVLLPFIVVGLLMIVSGASGANSTKFGGLSIFSLSSYTDTVDATRKMFADPGNPWFALASNKIQAFSTQVIDNFLHLISPDFLFLVGGGNHGHNITGFGNLYPIMFFGLVVGIAAIFIEREQWLKLMGIWILSASIAPMMTFEANHTTRFSPGFLVLEIISVYGWWKITQTVKKYFDKRWLIIFLSALTIGLSYSAYRFLINYYYVFPARDAQYWLWQIKPLVYFVDSVKDKYDAIYFQDERYSPYIYFLMYEPADPHTLASRIEYYPADAEGFRHVKRLDNIYFQTIDWQNAALYEGKNVLYIGEVQNIPDYNRTLPHMRELMVLKHDNALQQIAVWEYMGRSQAAE